MKNKTKDDKLIKDQKQSRLLTLKPKRIQPSEIDTNQEIKIYDNLNPFFTQKLREYEDILQRLLETKKKFLSSQHNPEGLIQQFLLLIVQNKALKEFMNIKFDNDSDLVVISGKVKIKDEELIYEKLKDPLYTETDTVECAFCGLTSKETKYYENLGEIYGPYQSKKTDEAIYAHDQCILCKNGVMIGLVDLKNVIFRSVNDSKANLCKLWQALLKELQEQYSRKSGASLHCAEACCRRQYHLPCLLYKPNKCKLLPYSFEVRCENHKDGFTESDQESNEAGNLHGQKKFSLVIECANKNQKNYEFNRMFKLENTKIYCMLCGYRVFKKYIEFAVQCSKCYQMFHEECIIGKLKINKVDKTCYQCFNCLRKEGKKKISKV